MLKRQQRNPEAGNDKFNGVEKSITDYRQRDSADPNPDGRQWLPVECLETVLVGEFEPLL